jgi:hypothetical protein
MLRLMLFAFVRRRPPRGAQLGIPRPAAQEVIVRPKEIDDVLTNPGIGFHTFQRFNGDDLNPGIRWTESHPIEYQPFDGDLPTPTIRRPRRPTSGLALRRARAREVRLADARQGLKTLPSAARLSPAVALTEGRRRRRAGLAGRWSVRAEPAEARRTDPESFLRRLAA